MIKEAALRPADTTERQLMKVITVVQMRFLGHVNRKETIEYLIMTGNPKGKEQEGGPG